MIVSCRDTVGADPALSPVVGDLVATPGARRMQLTPLSRAAVAELLDGHHLDPADVHRRTAGNPFFVSQILDQPDAPLPESVRDAVIAQNGRPGAGGAAQHRATRLRPRRREQRVAPGPRSYRRRPSGRSRPPVCSTGAAAGVAFRHEIARSAVLGAVAPGSEPALHATMIDALERDRRRRERARPPRGRRARRRADPAVRGRRRGRVRAGGRAPGGRRVLRARPAPRGRRPRDRADLLEALSVELYLTDRLDRRDRRRDAGGRPARRASPTPPPSAPGTPRSPAWRWYAADLATAPSGTTTPRSRSSPSTDDARALGFALANHSFLAAQRGDPPRPVPRAPRLQIADRWTAIRCCTASRRSGSPSPASSTATSRRGRTSSRPGTRACANATTTSLPPR